jgi:hypothetical protein
MTQGRSKYPHWMFEPHDNLPKVGDVFVVEQIDPEFMPTDIGDIKFVKLKKVEPTVMVNPNPVVPALAVPPHIHSDGA